MSPLSRAVIWIVRESAARLSDVAPTSFRVLSEESDWGLVGGDLRDAADALVATHPDNDHSDTDELVEAQ